MIAVRYSALAARQSALTKLAQTRDSTSSSEFIVAREPEALPILRGCGWAIPISAPCAPPAKSGANPEHVGGGVVPRNTACVSPC